jgi:antitoxin component YwqK of YwqJK toxin-antitoxin module
MKTVKTNSQLKKAIMSSLFLLILFSLITSCSESPKKETITIDHNDPIYDKDGKLFNGTKTGIVNGKKIEYEVKDGIKNGAFKTYFVNGNLEIDGQIEQNKNVGLWKYYYQDGTLESEGNFENDLVEGKWYWYYPSGKLKETSEYKLGLREGVNVMYDTSGNVTSKIIFEGGVEVKSE